MKQTNKTTKQDIIIRQLEHAFGIRLSKEQRAIVKYDFKSPVLVNACAGAGKTTLMLFIILEAMLKDNVQGSNVLSVTFSSRARIDMDKKYKHMSHQLNTNGIFLHQHYFPTFRTFDALFLHILKRYPEYKHSHVLPSYKKLSWKLYHGFKARPKNMSSKEAMKNIFDLRSYLIANGISTDGVTIADYGESTGEPFSTDDISDYADDARIPSSPEFCINYLNICQLYNRLKKHYDLIDFFDICILLAQKLRHGEGAIAIHYMSRFKYVFIDEFQDINTLDWKIITKILSKEALAHLTVIGDDDQSIYAFRGSNPRIILNYTKKYPSVKRFDLSTNYRTNGRVLKSVRPLIKNNKYRMNKDLSASHRIPGGLYVFCDSDYMDGGALLLHKALSTYKHTKSNQTAILVRFNSDKELAIDWLANRNVYLRAGKYLQQDRVYKAVMGIMTALLNNDLASLVPYLRYLGFYKYKKHIKWEIKQMRFMNSNKLSSFLDALEHKNEHRSIHTNTRQIDDLLIKTDKLFRYTKRISAHKALSQSFSLMHTYLDYMCKKRYLSEDVVHSIKLYLLRESKSFKTPQQYLQFENYKYKMLKYNTSDKTHLPIMTIHQSKGLQFKYVFLFNLTDRNVSLRMQKENKYFAPNISSKQFLQKIKHMSKAQLKDADTQDETVKTQSNETPYEDVHQMIANIQLISEKVARKKLAKEHVSTTERLAILMESITHSTLNEIASDCFDRNPTAVTIQRKFNNIYEQTLIDSMTVEEERRLIYVGITRAQCSAVFNYDEYSNPLLNELKIPKAQYMSADKNGLATPIDDNVKKQKLDELKKQERAMEKRRKEIENDLKKSK